MAEPVYVVSTVAGCSDAGFDDGRGPNTKFNDPVGLDFSKDGGILVADRFNHCIRKVTVTGSSPAYVETFAGVPCQAGNKDGKVGTAMFNHPTSVSVSDDGTVYVTDSYNHRIVLIDSSNNVRSLAGSGKRQVVDGNGRNASFVYPWAILWVKDKGLFVGGNGFVIRHVTKDGTVSTVAGTPGQHGYQNGDLRHAKFSSIVQIARSVTGQIFVADRDNHAIRVFDEECVKTFAGGNGAGFQDGPIELSKFNYLQGVAVHEDGRIFVADTHNHRIRMISPDTHVVSTIAGCGESGLQDGPGEDAMLDYPYHLLLDQTTNTLYFTQPHCLRKISLPKREEYYPKLESSMLQDLQSLSTDDSHLADVKFVVEEKPIYAHKRLLSVRSQYFNRMFSSGMKESLQSSSSITEISIPDTDYQSFKTLIVYLTTDQLTVDPKDYKSVCNLLTVSDQFMVDRLKMHCERVLERHIGVENVFELAHVSDHCKAEHLKDATLKFFAQHIDKLRHSPELDQLPKQFFIALMKRKLI
jgi:hypothetical protein